MIAPMLLLAMFAWVAAPARAQWVQQSEAGLPGVAPGGHAFLLEGAGVVRSEAAEEPGVRNAAAQEDEEDVRYIGGRRTQAGDPNAGDEPVRKLPPPASKDPFRPGFSINQPKVKAEPSPIVAKAREFMASPPHNPNNGTRDWTGWCLGFVNTTVKAVRGTRDPQLAQPAAKNAYYAMAAAGRLSKDFANVAAGAALLWANCSPWGHAAIATGEMSADGTPIMITTSYKGIREMSTKQFGCGLPTGWAKI